MAADDIEETLADEPAEDFGEAEASADARPAARPMGDGVLNRLHPSQVSAARVSGGIGVGVLASTLPIAVLALVLRQEPDRLQLAALVTTSIVLLGLAVLGAWFWPVLEYRNTSWRVDPEGLEIRRGVVWKHIISVPRERIQHTDVTRGPIQRRFGLATLVVHTAGTHHSEIHLGGVGETMAFAVRRYLLERVEGEDEDGV